MRDDKASLVLRLFSRVSSEYDALLMLFSFGRDRAWRKKIVENSRVDSNGRVLDVAAGTCLLAMDFVRYSSDTLDLVAADYSMAMLRQGKQNLARRGLIGKVELVNARAENLPFVEGTFQSVAISLALRNVSDVPATLKEMVRVSRDGGRVFSLDFTRPPHRLFRRFYYLYLFRVMPKLGLLVSREWKNLLAYLAHSIQRALTPRQIKELMAEAGLVSVKCIPLTWGVVTLLHGERAR